MNQAPISTMSSSHFPQSVLPDRVDSEEALDDLLTRPSPKLMEAIGRMDGPLLVLGAAGKMGPTLVKLARRAADAAGHSLDIIAVSRFSGVEKRHWMEKHGIRTITCDLLDPASVQQLPDAPNIIYLVGLKFGTQQSPELTWAVNTLVPTHVSERFRQSRSVALSTGNVYPLVRVSAGGAVETDPLTPLGEYPNAAVARERLFEYHSIKNATRMVLLRLNYAVELRYGVLVDVAAKVWANQPVDVTTGYFNCIWQGDANESIVRSFDLAASPPAKFNMTGSEVLSVRDLARRFGELMGRRTQIIGHEAETALLSNSTALWSKLGEPATPLDSVVQWTAHWVMGAKPTLGKPTHFEVRDGKY